MSIYGSKSAIHMAQDYKAGLPKGGESAPVTFTAKNMVFPQSAFEVVAIRLDVGAEAVRALGELLSPPERLRANCFAFERDRQRFIVARARLRQLLAERLDMLPLSIELVYGARGKPALAPRCTDLDLRFNLSHSHNVAVYAFARGLEIGIDVEAIRVIRDADNIATRFFSKRENKAYLALDPCDRPRGFFNCWTRKEAFIKAIGEGLYHPLDRFDVSLAPEEPAKILRVDNTPGQDCGWELQSLIPEPGFVASVVVQKIGNKVFQKFARRPAGLSSLVLPDLTETVAE
jgi:4'-phosphopantetheinyl transferase